MKSLKFPFFIAILSFLSLYLQGTAMAQQGNTQDSVQKTKVYLVHADLQSFNKNINDQRQVLNGNVVFRHDSSYMYCDSAYFFEQDRSLEAFGLVRMEQGDTLFVYGNYLFYDGNVEMAQMRNNVRMVSISDTAEVTLYTDSLDYDRKNNIGYYFEGGRIVDAENELRSFYGQYSPTTKIAIFQDSVILENPSFTLYSDTLEYSTASKIATILGPSTIVSDSGTIYSSKGWYDTQGNTSLLLDRSEVLSGDKILIGDSLFYDQNAGIGKAFGNMSIRDTAQKIILTGNYGYYDEKTEFAFATDSACAMEYSQGDTLYLHSDTLNLITADSVRILRAYTGVRFYRVDVQGVCDSMRFDAQDSVLRMYGTPILWNEEQQLSGDTIIVYMNDTTVEYVHVPTSALMVQQIDTGCYNQLGGNDMKAYFDGKNVRRVDIDGNAESIFYPLEKDSTMIGLNYTQSSYLSIWLKEGKLDRLRIWPNPKGTLTPVQDIKGEQRRLKKFQWNADVRPIDKYDIFRSPKRGGGLPGSSGKKLAPSETLEIPEAADVQEKLPEEEPDKVQEKLAEEN